jgi:uncharacterized OB-fold protein
MSLHGATPLPVPAPYVTPESRIFWEGTSRNIFMLQRCNACRTLIWYPRFMCPDCHSTDTAWETASGLGTVYSFTIVRRGVAEYLGLPPFVFAIVELAEGPRITTNIVECEPESVHIDQAVEVVFHDTGAGSSLTRFRPVVSK